MLHKLNLLIHSIKCVDETGGSFAERFGSDEIYLTGFKIDNSAKVQKISMFEVGGNFDDNSEKKYNPPRITASFEFSSINKPASFLVGLLLVEKDQGGVGEAAQLLFAKAAEEINKKRAALGTMSVNVLWAAAKEAIHAYAINELNAERLGDDLFPLAAVTTSIMNNNHTWYGRKTSPVSLVNFKGHNGHYQLIYTWELE